MPYQQCYTHVKVKHKEMINLLKYTLCICYCINQHKVVKEMTKYT